LSSSPTAVAHWCRFNGTGTVFIDPGSPWQDARIESFDAPMRNEHLTAQRFDTLSKPRSSPKTGGSTTTGTGRKSADGWLSPVRFVEAWLHRLTRQLA